MIRKLVLSFALVSAAFYTDFAHAKKTAAKAHAQPQAAVQEEAQDETMAAKLVVNSVAAPDIAAAPQVAAADATTAAAEALVAAPATSEATPIEAAASATSAASSDTIAKKDVSKLPESQIPVMTETKDKKETSSSGMMRVLITLGVLSVALGAITFGLKRWAGKKNSKGQNTKIQILTQHALGPKKSLMIVQVAGESLLVGVTDHNISMLKTLSLIDDEVPEHLPQNFNSALDEYVDDEPPRPRGGKKPSRNDRDDFAMRGLGEIRDTVSMRSKNLKN